MANISVSVPKVVECEQSDCNAPNEACHLILFRKSNDHDQLIGYFSCSACLIQRLECLNLEIESVLSIHKEGVGTIHWVAFPKDWISKSRWCEYNTQKLIWDPIPPWKYADLTVALVTPRPNNAEFKFLIASYISTQRAKSTSDTKSIEVHKSPLQTSPHRPDFKTDDSMSDLTIRVESKSYYCHRIILSQHSEYFKCLSLCDMKEKEIREVAIGEISPEAMEAYLDWVYHNKLDLSLDTIDQRLETAHRFLDQQLISACAAYLAKQLVSPMVIELAIRYKLEGVKQKMISLMCPKREPGSMIGARSFDVIPDSMKDLSLLSKEALEAILSAKMTEMKDTASSITFYAEQISSVLDAICSSQILEHLMLPMNRIQEIKALAVKMVASTSCSDANLIRMSESVRTAAIGSRALACGPCANKDCQKMALGTRDRWMMDPTLNLDIPGTYLCGMCHRKESMRMKRVYDATNDESFASQKRFRRLDIPYTLPEDISSEDESEDFSSDES